MSKEYRKSGNRVHHLNYHIVYCPKFRKKCLVGVVLEDLTAIRDGCKSRKKRFGFSKKQRGLFNRWSFAQLASFLTYKAERMGILVIFVDPRYSSQTCSQCGHKERANRKSQSRFCCKSCGYQVNADLNAATNLRQRGIASLLRLVRLIVTASGEFTSKPDGK